MARVFSSSIRGVASAARRFMMPLLFLLMLSGPGPMGGAVWAASAQDEKSQEALDEDALLAEAEAGLARACDFMAGIAYKGGYAGIYSKDLTERYGEALYERAAPTEIWVQPPGTPTMGIAFLEAYKVTGDDIYLNRAKAAGRALAWGQRTAGGWDHRVDVAHLDPEAKQVRRLPGHCTFDDNISQGALDFLIRLDEEVDAPWLDEAVDLAIEHLKKAQYPSGGWPQWYPLRGGYHDLYTFNDGAINDCIKVLLKAHGAYDRRDCLAVARKGGEFIIASQGKPPQAGWAQQMTLDLVPAKARSFEPAAWCSAVTARNLRTLERLFKVTGEKRFLEPFPAAVAWLRASRLDDLDGRGPCWARFYEKGTNRPIYGDRDGKVHYRLEEISEERRKGYSWQGEYGIENAIALWELLYARDCEGLKRAKKARADGSAPDPAVIAASKRADVRRLAPRVRYTLDALDDRGRWLDDDRITTKRFTREALLLVQYIALVREKKR